MNKFYALFLLSSVVYCSQESGKLPEDFKFRDTKEYTEEVSEKRSSFMSQWREYVEKVEGTNVNVTVTSSEELEIKTSTDKKGDVHITVSQKNN